MDGRARDPMADNAILLVDDEPRVLEGLKRFLTGVMEVHTTTSAAEGLKILDRVPIDVVVSDERMPGMSGSEFLAIVRQKFPDTIRIVLTGQASLEAAVRSINDGEVYRFLSKPCGSTDLIETIRNGLQLKQLREESAKLLATARKRRRYISNLENEHPGITTVERSLDGAISLESETEDPDDLLEDMRRESSDS